MLRAESVLLNLEWLLLTEGFVLRGRAVSEAAEALGLEIVGPSGGGARLLLPPLPNDKGPGGGGGSPADAPGGFWRLHRFPRDSFLGIPADPTAPDVVEVLGQRILHDTATFPFATIPQSSDSK